MGITPTSTKVLYAYINSTPKMVQVLQNYYRTVSIHSLLSCHLAYVHSPTRHF